MSSLLYKDESFKIIGACFEVYNQTGYGFTEPVYHECLTVEFALQNIPFVSQPEIPLLYKGSRLQQCFKPDFVCFEKIIVEIKAVSGLANPHRSQALNYLNATGFELAILVNFGEFPKLRYERLANTSRTTSHTPVADEIRSWDLNGL